MNYKGKLYIIPMPIGEELCSIFFDNYYVGILKNIRIFIVEEIKTSRRFLRKIIPDFPIDDSTFIILNEHIKYIEIEKFITPLFNGYDVALMSEAGCPSIADPGSNVILTAHKYNITVVPLIGPSSIFLSLMASGLNGQNFKFNGYLPVKKNERIKAILKLEDQSRKENITQIFIETPYRTKVLFNDILQNCSADTYLTIASNLTQSSEFIQTKTIAEWQKNCNTVQNVPTVFLLYSGKL